MDLNLRDVPPELVRELKLAAVAAELSLKGYCLERLSGSGIHIKKVANGELEGGDVSGGRPCGVGEEPRGVEKSNRKRSGDRAALPVLSDSSSDPERLHSVQQMRGELASGGDAIAGLPESKPIGSEGRCPEGYIRQVCSNLCRGKHKWDGARYVG